MRTMAISFCRARKWAAAGPKVKGLAFSRRISDITRLSRHLSKAEAPAARASAPSP